MTLHSIVVVKLHELLVYRGGSRRIARFLWESNTFHMKTKAFKMLSRKNLLDPPLHLDLPEQFVFNSSWEQGKSYGEWNYKSFP